jgi:uncharacterized protein (DUF2236 family)
VTAVSTAYDARAEAHGLFGPDSVTWRIHSDPAMVVGGFRALLLQATHPLVFAGFEANSSYRIDPWGRLQRTGEWLATVAFGTRSQAEQAGARLRSLHARLKSGTDPETGRSFRVDDPELLLWVHCTEVESFLSTYLRSGGRLQPGQADQYVDEMRESARLVGLDPADVPATTQELDEYFSRIRPTLHVTDVAAQGAIWGFVPPMPLWVKVLTPARPAWAGLVSIAAGLLPRWTRRLYGMPGLPTTDLAATIAARGVRRTLFALPDRVASNPHHAAAVRRVAEFDAAERSART